MLTEGASAVSERRHRMRTGDQVAIVPDNSLATVENLVIGWLSEGFGVGLVMQCCPHNDPRHDDEPAPDDMFMGLAETLRHLGYDVSDFDARPEGDL